MTKIHNLGFPRIGAKRELKFALEAYWKGQSSLTDLQALAAELMRALVSTGMRSRTLMEWVLRIMSNMLRPDELGPAEAIYKALEKLVAVGPEP